MNMYGERINKIWEVMEKRKLECVLLTKPEHTFYVSGYCNPSEGKPVILLVPLKKDPLMIIVEHEEELAKSESWITDFRTYVYYSINKKPSLDEQIINLVLKSLRELNITRGKVGIEVFHTSFALINRINKEIGNLEYEDLSLVLGEMCIVKSKEEVELIKKAVKLCDIGQDTVRKKIKEGVTEIELFSSVRTAMEIEAGEQIFLGADLVAGKRTEEGGGFPGEKKLYQEDLVMADLFPKIGGYWGDTTRTFAVERYSKKQKEIYEIVVEAGRKGIEAIKPGVRACDIDKVVRNFIKGAGYGDYFGHHTGHGIGLTHFEDPLIVPYNDCELVEGMVLTIEPGIYFPGCGGIRVEEDVLVTKNRGEVLSKYERRL